MDHPLDRLTRPLQERRDARLWRRHRTVVSRQGPLTQLADGEAPVLAFSSNDYLGLTQHPALIEAQSKALERWGVGSGASHVVCGHTQAHEELQDLLAVQQAGRIPEAQALGFATGYLANMAIFSTLAAAGGRSLQVFSDRLNHASLVHGAQAATRHHFRFAHGDLIALRGMLERAATEDPKALRAIVVDAVFSMDGDESSLPGLLALAVEFNALLVVDDAHGYGVVGPTGRGSLWSQWDEAPAGAERIIFMGTLGKAVGMAGAFVVAHGQWMDAMRQWAPEAIYTTASPPAQAEALCAAVALMHGVEGEALRQQLRHHIGALRAMLPKLGAAAAPGSSGLMPSRTAIQPWWVGGVAEALALAERLEAQGIWVPAIRPPTVPAGTARLRVSLSAAHTDHDLQRLGHALLESAS